MAKPTAAAIYERYVEYAANLQRLDAKIRIDVSGLLTNVQKELIAKLSEFDPSQPNFKSTRLQQLLNQTQQMLGEKYTNINAVVMDDLSNLVSVEQNFSAKTVNSMIGVELVSTAITPGLMKRIASDTLIMGAPSEEWWSRQADSTAQAFADQVRRGMAQGETLTQMSQRIRGVPTGQRESYQTAAGEQRYATQFAGGIMDTSRREADALVRSSVQAVSQSARLDMYQSNSDVIQGVQALVVLDNRTSTTCMARSGMSWTLDGDPIGDADAYPGPPPWHFNCRTTFIPITKTWKQLAPSDKEDIAQQADDAGVSLDKVQASMDGPVDAGMNYEDWLDTKSEDFQKELLGPTKYALWNDDKISFRDLIDQSGNPLTVSELQEKFG